MARRRIQQLMKTGDSMDWVTAQTLLLTDRKLRDSFRADPHEVARQLPIQPEEIPMLTRMSPDQLDAQANTLVQKRFHEVGKLLPGTVAALGLKASPVFTEYASTYWPKGHQRHLLDASRFSRHLRGTDSRELHTSEQNWVEFLLRPRILRVVPVLLRRTGGKQYPCLQILTAFRGRMRQRFYYLAVPLIFQPRVKTTLA